MKKCVYCGKEITKERKGFYRQFCSDRHGRLWALKEDMKKKK